MPARAPIYDLVVNFSHGKETQEETATSGRHALQIAFRMLVQCDELHEGDLLSISRRPTTKPYVERRSAFDLATAAPCKTKPRIVRRTDG